jgi:predicted nucleotidyltransferase
MTNSSLDLSARADLDWLAELIGDAQQAAPRFEWLIVGALARDLHLSYAYGIRVDRVTTDTDLALAISSWSVFSGIREALIQSRSFSPDRRVEHKFLHRSGRAVDVVPFGNIEDADGEIAWPPSGAVRMSVVGYREALVGSTELILPHGRHVRMVSLVGLLILKLIAWSQRHRSAPGKDAYDLRALLTHYLDAGNLERLYGEHIDLVDVEFDYPIAGARVAGRDASTFLRLYSTHSKAVHGQLCAILDAEIDAEGGRVLIGQSGAPDPEEFRKLLAAFLLGLNEGQHS